MISTNLLSKSYGETCIIHGRSDSFSETGFYLLLGESGSGKTTYLNVLYGLVPFERGTVIIDGTEYAGKIDTTIVSHIAEYITQDAYFVEFLTIKENLLMVSDNEEEIIDLTDRFHLKNQLDQHPNSLSGGERQRFAVVRALLRKKRILFLDEPTASLDEANKQEVFSLLKDLKEEVLILCASHDKKAELYADVVLSFSKDDVEEKGLLEISAPVTLPYRTMESVSEKNTHGKNPLPWLLKYFRHNKKHKTESLIFIFFLMTAFCLSMFADFPNRKMDITRASLYQWNTLPVYLMGFHRFEEMNLSDGMIREVVLDYAMSCPDGNEDVDLDNEMGTLPEYELDDVLTLPADKELFRLSDRIIYGSYFTDKDQILLTYEMAEQMSPSDPGALIGKHLTKKNAI
ncbi:MAG: ATP-binding cassette domain-containing protein [Clostridiales bacterium]|nr:ATP-binding cassette domain-containing protein [Clostridiales bacterium]